MDINYSEYMSNMIENIDTGMPIFTDTVIKTVAKNIGLPTKDVKHVVNLNLKRLADDSVIERIQKGVYYKPKVTVFGKTKPPIDLVINETCIKSDNQTIGYIGEQTLLHNLGLTTLMPKSKVIVTNKYRTKIAKENQITLKKPTVKITNENVRYLQMIDTIAMLETEYIDADNPNKIIRQAIENFTLDKFEMIKIARVSYPKKVFNAVVDVLVEEVK